MDDPSFTAELRQQIETMVANTIANMSDSNTNSPDDNKPETKRKSGNLGSYDEYQRIIQKSGQSKTYLPDEIVTYFMPRLAQKGRYNNRIGKIQSKIQNSESDSTVEYKIIDLKNNTIFIVPYKWICKCPPNYSLNDAEKTEKITKRPIELWRDYRAALNAERVYHFPLWNFRNEISIFKHEIDYDHFCVIYSQLHPLLNAFYCIPNGISKFIAEYATGFFDECDDCKCSVHILFETEMDKSPNFCITNKCVKDKYPFIKISCLCHSCKQQHLLIKVIHVQGNIGLQGNIVEIWFKLKRSTKMKKIMAAYAARTGFRRGKLSLEFENMCIMNDMTPNDLGMKDEDIIHAQVLENEKNENKVWSWNSEFKWKFDE